MCSNLASLNRTWKALKALLQPLKFLLAVLASVDDGSGTPVPQASILNVLLKNNQMYFLYIGCRCHQLAVVKGSTFWYISLGEATWRSKPGETFGQRTLACNRSFCGHCAIQPRRTRKQPSGQLLHMPSELRRAAVKVH